MAQRLLNPPPTAIRAQQAVQCRASVHCLLAGSCRWLRRPGVCKQRAKWRHRCGARLCCFEPGIAPFERPLASLRPASRVRGGVSFSCVTPIRAPTGPSPPITTAEAFPRAGSGMAWRDKFVKTELSFGIAHHRPQFAPSRRLSVLVISRPGSGSRPWRCRRR